MPIEFLPAFVVMGYGHSESSFTTKPVTQ